MNNNQGIASQTAGLARRLTTGDAIMVGLGSMIGAGIFAVFAPAAGIAGAGMLVGLLIAAAVALLNALSSAQLSAQYPVSGGTYIFAREQLGNWPGFFAGWSFVIGKTASCAAMALTVAFYLVGEDWVKPVAIAAVLGLALVNSFGITRTVGLTKIIVTLVLIVLAIVLASAFFAPDAAPPALPAPEQLFGSGWYAIFQASGLLFFAFAGYARVATMGEEVRNPRKSIPRAIITALLIVLGCYLLLGLATLSQLGPESLANSNEPLATLVLTVGWDWAVPVVRIGAALGALGALLALLTGLSRTILAMARNQDLPGWLGVVEQKYRVPRNAELVLAIVISVLIMFFELRTAIGFSSFGVLLYYFITNISAFTQDRKYRRYPRILAVLGALACLLLVATLPWQSVLAGLVVLIVGIGYRWIRTRTIAHPV